MINIVTQDHIVQSHGITQNHVGSHEVTRESIKVVKFEVINQFWIVRFHCYSHSELSRGNDHLHEEVV